MARQEPQGKWAFAPGGRQGGCAARTRGPQGVGSRTAAQVKSLKQQSEAARRGRN